MIKKGTPTGLRGADWHVNIEGVFGTLRAAAFIIKNNKLLVAKNKDYDCYYAIGGAIKINETSEEGIIREIYEEIGYKLEIEMLAFIVERFLEVNRQLYHEVDFFYLMKDNANMCIPEGLNTDYPGETLHWLPLEKLCQFNIVPEFLKTRPLNNLTTIEHIISKE